jgi:hypothetical protein
MAIGKAKNIIGKATFVKINERALILKELTGKSLNTLGKEAGVSNGTADDWSDKQVGKPTRTVKDFLRFHGINEQWWKTGEGDVFNKKRTYVELPSNNKEMENPRETVYQTIVEGHTEYVLIPRSIMKDTQLISSEQIKRTWDELAEKNKELERKNGQINFYHKFLEKYLEGVELPKPPNSEKV